MAARGERPWLTSRKPCGGCWTRGALVPDGEANERLRNAAGTQHRDFAFRTTRRGPREAAWGMTGRAGESRHQQRCPTLVMCDTMLIVSLYLE